MKKTALSTALALAFAVSAAAPGHAGQTLMERAIQNASEVKSYRSDFESGVSMSMSMMGQTHPLDSVTRGTIEWVREPLRTKSDITSSGAGQSTHAVAYAEKAGDDFIAYTKADGGSWTKATLGGSMVQSMTGSPDLSQLLALAADFEASGSETVRGAGTTVFSGVLSADDLKGVMDLGAMSGAIASAMGVDLGDLDLGDFGGIPMSVSICDETGMLVKYTMDMTGFMKKLGPVIVERTIDAFRARAGSSGFDPATLGFRFDFGKTWGEAVFYDYDEVGPIEIPAEARSAKPRPLFAVPGN